MNRVLCCARRSARLYRAGAYGSCAAYGIRNERQKNPAREAVPSQYRVFKGLFLRSFVSFVRKKTPFSRNMPENAATGARQGLPEAFMAQMPQACRSGTAILRLAQRAWGTGMTLPERTSLRKAVSFRPLRIYAALLARCGRFSRRQYRRRRGAVSSPCAAATFSRLRRALRLILCLILRHERVKAPG